MTDHQATVKEIAEAAAESMCGGVPLEIQVATLVALQARDAKRITALEASFAPSPAASGETPENQDTTDFPTKPCRNFHAAPSPAAETGESPAYRLDLTQFEGATPRPWKAGAADSHGGPFVEAEHGMVCFPDNEKDAFLIAAAVNELPPLLAELRQTRATLDQRSRAMDHQSKLLSEARARVATLEAEANAVYCLSKGPVEQAWATPLSEWVKTRFVHVEDHNEALARVAELEGPPAPAAQDGDWVEEAAKEIMAGVLSGQNKPETFAEEERDAAEIIRRHAPAGPAAQLVEGRDEYDMTLANWHAVVRELIPQKLIVGHIPAGRDIKWDLWYTKHLNHGNGPQASSPLAALAAWYKARSRPRKGEGDR